MHTTLSFCIIHCRKAGEINQWKCDLRDMNKDFYLFRNFDATTILYKATITWMRMRRILCCKKGEWEEDISVEHVVTAKLENRGD